MTRFILIVTALSTTIAQAQTVVPSSPPANPGFSGSSGSGDPPLDDICASGSPPDVVPKLSIPVLPAMLQAAHTRALSAKTTAGDGIGVAIGPDGNMHIVLDPSVRIASGYRYLYNWSALAPRAIPKGPTVQPPLTEFELVLNELAWMRNDRGQRVTNFIYYLGEFGQTILAARVAGIRKPPVIEGVAVPGSRASNLLRPRLRRKMARQSVQRRRERQERDQEFEDQVRDLWQQLQDKKHAYLDPTVKLTMDHVKAVAAIARDAQGNRIEILVTYRATSSRFGFPPLRYIQTDFLTNQVFLGTNSKLLLHTHPGGDLTPSPNDLRRAAEHHQYSVVIMNPRTGEWKRTRYEPDDLMQALTGIRPPGQP